MQTHAVLVLVETLAQCVEELHVMSSETRLKSPTYQGTISKPKPHSALQAFPQEKGGEEESGREEMWELWLVWKVHTLEENLPSGKRRDRTQS